MIYRLKIVYTNGNEYYITVDDLETMKEEVEYWSRQINVDYIDSEVVEPRDRVYAYGFYHSMGQLFEDEEI